MIEVTNQVMQKIANEEAFTSACISHPLIEQDNTVRHRDVSQVIKDMWAHGNLIDNNGHAYLRSLITVYPDGPQTSPAQAWLYYPDNGFDPSDFTSNERILIRKHYGDDTSSSISIVNTADGSKVSKQVDVQAANKTLNIPRHIIKAAGWKTGDCLAVSTSTTTVTIKLDKNARKRVDKEGRIRIHGKYVACLETSSPTAILVEPDQGDAYIQIYNVKCTDQKTATPDADTVLPNKPILSAKDLPSKNVLTSKSVWS